MLLRYTGPQGERLSFPLENQPITIGRSKEADIVLDDEKASRMHCGIAREGRDHVLKDLQSKNGTFVNGELCHQHNLQPTDRIRIGSTFFVVEEGDATGADTAVQEVQDELADGKGYGTLLREIVSSTAPKRPSDA